MGIFNGSGHTAPDGTVRPEVLTKRRGGPVFESIKTNPLASNTGIGIVWFVAPGESQRLDLDLYVWVPRDGVELFYRNPVSRSGRYFRDVRQASGSAQSEWRASYEFVELQGDQIPPEIWINVYAGKGPAQGELRVQHGGKEYRIAFLIPAVRGNEGNDRNGRSKNEHWLKIDLLPLLQAP